MGARHEALTNALDGSGLAYTVAEGEGAFYGPKVDFHFHDAIGRLWQLTTVQCDFALPERFDMEYVGEDNERHRPVMIHRAILGSLERFSGGADRALRGVVPAVARAGAGPVRAGRRPPRRPLPGAGGASAARPVCGPSVDEAKETVGKKIRAAQLMKIPYTLVVGDREIEAGTFTVRDRAGDEHPGVPFDRFVAALTEEAATRSLAPARFALRRAEAAVERLWSPWRMEYIQREHRGVRRGPRLRLLRPAGRRAR